MKICVIELTDTNTEAVLGNERLANLRRLMDFGLYGKLQVAPDGTVAGSDTTGSASAALWPPLAGACQQAIFMRPPASSRSEAPEAAGPSANDPSAIADPSRPWTLLIDQLMNPNWDYLHFVSPAPANAGRMNSAQSSATDNSLALDDQIGRVIDTLDDQTALLVIGGADLQGPNSGFFILVSPTCPIGGEFQNASLADLAPTLLDLTGRSSPDGLPGRSLVAGLEKRSSDEASADHERIVLDRLAGLGYV